VKYTVTMAGREFEVTVNGDEVQLNGNRVAASLTRVPGAPLRQLLVGDRSHVYVVRDGGESWTVARGGEERVALVEDERSRRLRRLAGSSQPTRQGGLVKAPMPGLVVRVSVEPGQSVQAGSGVVVLEAMKMENEISCPSGGTVSAVHVQPGQAVEKGAVLVEVSTAP
jgi:pyruvate carboxylase subunit B